MFNDRCSFIEQHQSLTKQNYCTRNAHAHALSDAGFHWPPHLRVLYEALRGPVVTVLFTNRPSLRRFVWSIHLDEYPIDNDWCGWVQVFIFTNRRFDGTVCEKGCIYVTSYNQDWCVTSKMLRCFPKCSPSSAISSLTSSSHKNKLSHIKFIFKFCKRKLLVFWELCVKDDMSLKHA